MEMRETIGRFPAARYSYRCGCACRRHFRSSAAAVQLLCESFAQWRLGVAALTDGSPALTANLRLALHKFASAAELRAGTAVWSHKFGDGVVTEFRLGNTKKPFTVVYNSGAVLYSTKLALSKLFVPEPPEGNSAADVTVADIESVAPESASTTKPHAPALRPKAQRVPAVALSVLSASESNIRSRSVAAAKAQPIRADTVSSRSAHDVSRAHARSRSRDSTRSPPEPAEMPLDLRGFLRAWKLERLAVTLAELGAVEPVDLLDLDQGGYSAGLAR